MIVFPLCNTWEYYLHVLLIIIMQRWQCVTTEEKEEIEHLQAYNRKLIANILPEHVAEHFLSLDKAPDVSVYDITQMIR